MANYMVEELKRLMGWEPLKYYVDLETAKTMA